jgi:hypothetical protein
MAKRQGIFQTVRKAPKRRAPLEQVEQVDLAGWLDGLGVVWSSIPLGEARTRTAGAKLKAAGVKRGIPDVLIFSPCAGFVGMAVELKRADGVPSDVKTWQADWLEALRSVGWLAVVAYGAEDAKRQILAAGYGR